MSEGYRFAAVPTAAVRDPRVSKEQFRTLAELSTYADAEGWCWPRQRVMAEHLGITRQTVNAHLKAMETLGYVEIQAQHREDGGRRENRYRVVLDTPPVNPEPDKGCQTQELQGMSAPEATARTPQENTPEEHPTGAAAPRKRNPLFDALVTAFGEASTPTRASFYGATVRELKQAEATPEQVIQARAEMARRGWTNPTPKAMLEHWDDLLGSRAKPPPGESRFDRQAEHDAARSGQ